MSMPLNSRLMALDADGVLLDYNRAYAHAWQRAFGEFPAERDPQAYWAIDRWAVTQLSDELLARFRASFDADFWRNVPALPNAVDACQRLSAAGYELVCVSALPLEFAQARLNNLKQHGFPIERVIATSNAGHQGGERSVKADALQALRPAAFVDDFLPYFNGVPQDMHRALILREPNGSPNVGSELGGVQSTYADLAAFADWWLGRSGDSTYEY